MRLAVAESQVDQALVKGLIQDIINDPREYAPFLLLLAGVLLLWTVLCASGFLSIRAATQRRRFWLAVVSILLGLPCICGNIPLSIEAQGFRLNADLRWVFIVPVAFGLTGLALFWKRRREIPV